MQLPSAPKPLPAFYYLENFLALISAVEDQYSDIFSDAEKSFLQKFNSLSVPHQALMVRLFGRKGTLFRSDKLAYGELPNLASLISEIEVAGFIKLNPDDVDIEALLGLCTKPELLSFWPELIVTLPRSISKSQLIEELADLNYGTYYQPIPFQILQVQHQAVVDLLLLLFFGHPYQDLTTFVTAELGHLSYENYSLKNSTRLFKNRDEINTAFELMELRDKFYKIEEFTEEEGLALINALPKLPVTHPLQPRKDRLCNRIGKACEQIGATDLAMQCYSQSHIHPSRERIARIHFKQKQFQQALDLSLEILTNPRSDAEQFFANRFIPQCQKKLGLEQTHFQKFSPDNIAVQLINKQARVELLAMNFIEKEWGGKCYYVENWLFNTIFGLTFWPAIFSTVQGAFTHPFQSAPHDLYDTEFYTRRKAECDHAFELIESNIWYETVLERWTEKKGISNSFVGWLDQGPEIISLALKHIPVTAWIALFKRMFIDLKHNCSGFPDLIHFPSTGGYHLYEVKSPTDNVQANQLRWMEFFDKHFIPCSLLRVEWDE